ncbi:HAD family hydrolase [Rubellimicrobium arenae]|uniref:HAD family hydrolase n=1 Tax=Rubellimicrobium arenae TaxID=2817372 RepID=UPI001B30C33D|nr:HAD family hydrolase [Rubellimicrobium arenae]
MTPSLVIFDCDGVLIDSEVISARVLVELAREAGVMFDEAYVRRNFLGRSFPTVARHIREVLGAALPADFEAAYRRRLLERFEVDLRPTTGVLDVLARLAVRACVATSSSPERAARSLAIAGLDRFFPRVFTASEVPRGKPAPDLFLHAAQQMGVAPQACLVIEDSAPGLEAAQAAGMQVAFFAGASHLASLRDGDIAQPFDSESRLTPFWSWTDLVAVYPTLVEARPESELRS